MDRTLVLKVIYNDRKFLTDHEIIDLIAEQIESMIINVCQKLKFWIHPNLQRPSFSFTYSFKFTYFYIVYIYIDLKKGILFKKIKKHSKPLNLQQNINICHKLT